MFLRLCSRAPRTEMSFPASLPTVRVLSFAMLRRSEGEARRLLPPPKLRLFARLDKRWLPIVPDPADALLTCGRRGRESGHELHEARCRCKEQNENRRGTLSPRCPGRRQLVLELSGKPDGSHDRAKIEAAFQPQSQSAPRGRDGALSRGADRLRIRLAIRLPGRPTGIARSIQISHCRSSSGRTAHSGRRMRSHAGFRATRNRTSGAPATTSPT